MFLFTSEQDPSIRAHCIRRSITVAYEVRTSFNLYFGWNNILLHPGIILSLQVYETENAKVTQTNTKENVQ